MSRASSIRSAARATFSAHRRIPIRWRLAGGSALLTLVILLAFAVAVGALTSQRIYDDFERDAKDAADELRAQLDVHFSSSRDGDLRFRFHPNLRTFVSGDEGAAARIVHGATGEVIRYTRPLADLGPPVPGSNGYDGWLVETRTKNFAPPVGTLVIQYGKPVESVEATVRQFRLFLVGGVIGGAGLALLAGLMVARRAMSPIEELTDAARTIERTRDPGRRVPRPEADDEVAELARTLDGMLRALDAARDEQDAMLRRQREFVADASHELRTPLTSVLANLEFLAETLVGEQGDAATSALRSSRRMRRLVQDLLLLARADARRVAPHEPLDVGRVVVEAAAELEPVADGHGITVDARPVLVDGARDELHRLVLNLLENAVKHTPPGTSVHASVHERDGRVEIAVEDDGPGIAPELRDRVFERFVRGCGDRGASFGLGLAIVRAVAESHGGTVRLTDANGRAGARFVVSLPAVPARHDQPLLGVG
ncbi:MAG TPA: HAMP domain-containing sensor histidine kinase [Solirubrobacteraceae bacterium]|nr:HAMP domain-containing sensor histidine kinase [Solirubrobacteraceae bacterium]